MENKAHAFVAGIFAIALALAGTAAIWWFGGKRESTVDYLVVTRQNVSGLNLQGPVRYRGIRVGRVESVRLDPDDARNILIRISVADEIPITAGTRAKLGYQGLTGIAHILLEDNGSDPRPLDRSKGLPRIDMHPSFMQELSDTAGATLKQAHVALSGINELLSKENRERVGRTLANVESGSANLSATLAQTKALLADPRLQQMGAMVANLNAASSDVRTVLREVAVLVPRMTALAEKIDQMVGETNGEGLAASSVRLQELGREMTAASRQLAETLQVLEDAPQSVLFGPPLAVPGPGEPGFSPPAVTSRGKP